MRVKGLYLLLSAGLLLTGIGCPPPEDTPPDNVVIDRTLLIEEGASPVWIDSTYTSFLFVYQEGEGLPGIYRSDDEGNIEDVYIGAHNHDYEPSPDGSMVAFSTPDPNGGVLVVTFGTDGYREINGAKSPTWINNTALVFTDADGQLVRYDLGSGESEVLFPEGSYPIVSPDGLRVAYLVNSSNTGLALRYAPLETLEAIELADLIGTDITWSNSGASIFASQLSAGTLSDVVKIRLATSNNTEIEMFGATRPSTNHNGTVLYANRVTTGGSIGMTFKDLVTGERINIPNAINPAAGNGRELLAEQEDGIYFISF